MLESSFGLLFFQKVANKPQKERFIYLRVTVDGIPKEMSTKRKWDKDRWNQETGRATGTKEDARSLNNYLESLTLKIHQAKTDLIQNDITVTSQNLMDIIQGKVAAKTKVLEEFQIHNNEMLALVRTEENPDGEFAAGTHERYVTARSHVAEFIKFKYSREDLEFRELNFQFVKDYEFWLRTVRKCNNNTTLKYIANFKKIVFLAVAKNIISVDPFKLFKSKKNKTKKKPLTKEELRILENHVFTNERLATIRDVFVFQCYTGLAYIDVFQLKPGMIGTGIDGEKWIISNRQKTDSDTNIPLLPKAIEIIEKYKRHSLCLSRGSVLPVKSNQKMNEYLKEIGNLCGFSAQLNTHKARRTFASTVTLGNDVPIDTVKEMLGHESVLQTEEYALTSQEKISRNMMELKMKLQPNNKIAQPLDDLAILERIGKEIEDIKQRQFDVHNVNIVSIADQLAEISRDMENLKNRFRQEQKIS